MDATELKIFKMINDHRRQMGLPTIAASNNLAYVARTHAVDVIENRPDVNGGDLHSWSNKGKWTPVRYTEDHSQAFKAWRKPSEISNYKFNAYEISFANGGSKRKFSTVNPTVVVNDWIESAGHNAVMIEQDSFEGANFKALGVGVYKGYACAWFGEAQDKLPFPQ